MCPPLIGSGSSVENELGTSADKDVLSLFLGELLVGNRFVDV